MRDSLRLRVESLILLADNGHPPIDCDEVTKHFALDVPIAAPL